jgi:hypothetical protein
MSEPVARSMSEPVARGIGQLNQAAQVTRNEAISNGTPFGAGPKIKSIA